MRILFLNRFTPPESAPTSRLLEELGEHLSQKGWDVQYISGSIQSYRSGSDSGGKNKALPKLLAYPLAHFLIFWRTLFAPKADIILSLTDPVALSLNAQLLAKLTGAKHVHWVMDLYPELAMKIEAIPDNFATRSLQKLMHRSYQKAELLITLCPEMSELLPGSAPVCRPWVEKLPPASSSVPKIEGNNSATFSWLYSGNLGRAHEWETLLEAQAIIEKETDQIELIFQGGGASVLPAQEKAAKLNLNQCRFRDYAPKERFLISLMEADAHIVTLRPELSGCLWASKQALLLELPQPLLWVGPADSCAEEARSKSEGSASFLPGQSEELASKVLSLAKDYRTDNNSPEAYDNLLEQCDNQRLSSLMRLEELLSSI